MLRMAGQGHRCLLRASSYQVHGSEVLSGDGSSPGGLAPEMLGGWGKGDEYGEYGWDWSEYGGGKGRGKGALPKVEKQIIQGCDLRGRLKSYNAEPRFETHHMNHI